MGEMSPWHWAIVIGIALLLFGAKRLPDAARSIGRSARILKAELGGESTTTPTPAAPESTAPPAAVTLTKPDPAEPSTVAPASAGVAPVVPAPPTEQPPAHQPTAP